MQFGRLRRAVTFGALLALLASPALAAPSLVVDVDSGQTLIERDATTIGIPPR